MKDDTILLIVALAVFGLAVGAYCCEDMDSGNSQNKMEKRIYEESGDILTITLNENNVVSLDKFFT